MGQPPYVEIFLLLGHSSVPRKQATVEGYSHDWRIYVKGPEGKKIENFIEKVIFVLHEDFPNHRRVFKEPPYEVRESGYAGFELPIEIYFRNKEEPKMITFLYDLTLLLGDEVNNVRREKLTFQNPSPDFKRKLIKSGGEYFDGSRQSSPKSPKMVRDRSPTRPSSANSSSSSHKNNQRPSSASNKSTTNNSSTTTTVSTSNKMRQPTVAQKAMKNLTSALSPGTSVRSPKVATGVKDDHKSKPDPVESKVPEKKEPDKSGLKVTNPSPTSDFMSIFGAPIVPYANSPQGQIKETVKKNNNSIVEKKDEKKIIPEKKEKKEKEKENKKEKVIASKQIPSKKEIFKDSDNEKEVKEKERVKEKLKEKDRVKEKVKDKEREREKEKKKSKKDKKKKRVPSSSSSSSSSDSESDSEKEKERRKKKKKKQKKDHKSKKDKKEKKKSKSNADSEKNGKSSSNGGKAAKSHRDGDTKERPEVNGHKKNSETCKTGGGDSGNKTGGGISKEKVTSNSKKEELEHEKIDSASASGSHKVKGKSSKDVKKENITSTTISFSENLNSGTTTLEIKSVKKEITRDLESSKKSKSISENRDASKTSKTALASEETTSSSSTLKKRSSDQSRSENTNSENGDLSSPGSIFHGTPGNTNGAQNGSKDDLQSPPTTSFRGSEKRPRTKSLSEDEEDACVQSPETRTNENSSSWHKKRKGGDEMVSPPTLKNGLESRDLLFVCDRINKLQDADILQRVVDEISASSVDCYTYKPESNKLEFDLMKLDTVTLVKLRDIVTS